jgi:small subunit ribosomal protein S8
MASVSDPIADLLTRIRNALGAQHRYVDVDWSRLKENIVSLLKEQGFIAHFLVRKDDKKGTMRIFLKYTDDRQSLIQGLRRVSSPGLRRYVGWREIPRVLGGMGIAIVSTSKGILADSKAREEKVGGELLCLVW